ncbi:MAG TPA: cyclase family protein [Thermobifida alba]|nr:cyclase family protein [Thermobifida alba]
MFLDLSVPVTERTPVYPGDPRIRIEPAADLTVHGYRCHRVSMGTHAGTHVDAPSHMLADGAGLDRYPVERFVGRGRHVDARGGFTLDAVRRAGIAAGDIVLFHTGMGDRYHEPSYFTDHPALPLDIAEYLVERRVSMVGVDMCSVDHEPFETHRTLLAGDVLIIENLTGLDRLAGREFRVYALPLRLEADGAPVRAVAELR